jgi:SAM-dependent methyltransferase
MTTAEERLEFLELLALPAGARVLEVVDGRIDAKNDSCDAVLCIDGIARIADHSAALTSWARALKPGGKLLYTDPGILGGLVTSEEVAIRSGGGMFVLSPQGENEGLIEAAGLWLKRADDATEALAMAVERLAKERAGREAELVAAEGRAPFDAKQRALAMTHRLAVARRLVRIAFLAEKPA